MWHAHRNCIILNVFTKGMHVETLEVGSPGTLDICNAPHDWAACLARVKEYRADYTVGNVKDAMRDLGYTVSNLYAAGFVENVEI